MKQKDTDKLPIWTLEDHMGRNEKFGYNVDSELIVNETFRFGKYTVNYGIQKYQVTIPYRLGNSDLF